MRRTGKTNPGISRIHLEKGSTLDGSFRVESFRRRSRPKVNAGKGSVSISGHFFHHSGVIREVRRRNQV
jgi:hypothetical protein